jgi:hypothetical protein
MKNKYSKIWELAKSYYKKGRPMDMDHIEWMMEDAAFVCKREKLDDSLLLPLVILHDVGYAEVPKDNPFKLSLREAHMKTGARIAKQILEKVDYPREKTEKIAYYVSVHDNWAFGDIDIYKKDMILGIFTDLDFTWMATPKGFPALMKILKKNHNEMIEYLGSRETPAKGLPFSSETTKQLFEKYLADRKKELKES